MKTTGLIILLGCWGTIQAYAQQWIQMDEYPGVKRDDAVSFTIGNIAYVGTGMDEGFNMHSNFFAYDMGAETWTQIQSLPDSAKRQYASGFSYDGFGYVFGGVNQSGNYLSDLWRYDPSIDSWQFIDSTLYGGRSGAMIIMENDSIYFVGGKTAISFASDEVISYDISSGQWLTRSSLPATLFRGVSFNWAGFGYVGSGLSDNQALDPEFYRYKFSDDSWEYFPQLQLQVAGAYSAFAQIDSSVYICTGIDGWSTFMNTFQRINIPSQTSELLNVFPSAERRGAKGFANAVDFYLTTGLSASGQRYKETWKAEHVVSIAEQNTEVHFYHYIENNTIHFVCEKPFQIISIVDVNGRKYSELKSMEECYVDVADFPNGTYYYLVEFEESIGCSKFMIVR